MKLVLFVQRGAGGDKAVREVCGTPPEGGDGWGWGSGDGITGYRMGPLRGGGGRRSHRSLSSGLVLMGCE